MTILAKITNFFTSLTITAIFLSLSLLIFQLMGFFTLEYSLMRSIVKITSILVVISLLFKIISLLLNMFRSYPRDILREERYDKIPDDLRKSVYVIIPAYNEEDSIFKAVNECKKFVDNVIVINDGSSDNTEQNAIKANAIVVSHLRNGGLAKAMKTGIQECINRNASTIINFDADLQYNASDIPSLVVPVLNGEYDLMIANRFAGGIEKMPFIKRFGNKSFSRVIANITNTHISDAQSGFRAFSSEFAKKIKIREGFTYTQQMIIEASEKDFKIGEIPIFFSKRDFGDSRLMHNPIHFALSAWKLIFQVYMEYQPLKLFLFPAFLWSMLGITTLNISLLSLLNNTIIGLLWLNISIISLVAATILIMFGFQYESKVSKEIK